MPDNLLLLPKTKNQMGQVLIKPPQALLVYGPAGSGKLSLAQRLASQLLDVPNERLEKHPHFHLLEKAESKKDIPIESVREVIRKLQLKAADTGGGVNRVVLIHGAHLLSAEAQNALLKAIEEPPAGTVFILSAISDSAVLPTIASRAQKLAVIPISLPAAKEYFSGYNPEAVQSAWALSGGTAGLLSALLSQDTEHPLKIAVESAKKILSKKKYDRLLLLDSLSSDKEEFGAVLDAMGRLLGVLHHSAIKSDNHSQARKIAQARKLVNSTISSLQNNTSARLLALNFAIGLPI